MAVDLNGKRPTDVLVENHGTVFVFQPLTAEARLWIGRHVQSEPYQWLGGGLVVDHRYAANLAAGMVQAGLAIR